MTNFGQVCISTDYVLCHESKLEDFVAAFKKQLKVGYDGGKNIEGSGKIISAFHFKRLCGLLEDHGGKVLIGNPEAYKDFKFECTVILNPRKDSALMREEIFGSILPIITYKNIDEAMKYIRDEQEKPLAVYFFGQRYGENYERLSRGTSSGSFVTNTTIIQATVSDLPFGGVGHSGYGRCMGVQGFQQFSNMKSFMVKPSLNFFPFNAMYPPHTEEQKKQAKDSLVFMRTTQAKFCQTILLINFVFMVVVLAIVFRASIFGGGSSNASQNAEL